MTYADPVKAAAIVRDSGGRVVGRTRLQKIAYLLSVTGLGNEFDFVYKHYGPYSDELASAARVGALFGTLSETENETAWGGTYSIYSTEDQPDTNAQGPRRQLAQLAADADAIELELAATAVFLSFDGYEDAWGETERRKPEKSTGGRIEHAKSLFQQLRAIDVPIALPNIT